MRSFEETGSFFVLICRFFLSLACLLVANNQSWLIFFSEFCYLFLFGLLLTGMEIFRRSV